MKKIIFILLAAFWAAGYVSAQSIILSTGAPASAFCSMAAVISMLASGWLYKKNQSDAAAIVAMAAFAALVASSLMGVFAADTLAAMTAVISASAAAFVAAAAWAQRPRARVLAVIIFYAAITANIILLL